MSEEQGGGRFGRLKNAGDMLNRKVAEMDENSRAAREAAQTAEQERKAEQLAQEQQVAQTRQESTQQRIDAASQGQIDFDNANQLQRIQGGLIPGETLYAVYDMKGAGTGFVGITDRRLIIQDEGRIRKGRSLITLPYSRITMLASKDEGGMLRRTSELTVYAGSQEFEFEFRSGDKAERAYTYIVQHLK